jgi:hypothetical protein
MDDFDNKSISLLREDLLSKNVINNLENQLSFIDCNIKLIQNLYYKKETNYVK